MGNFFSGNGLQTGAPIYTYEIDSDDRIVNCNDGWDEFAIENEGHALVSEKICGTSIWNHISEATTVELYKKIFQSAREGKPVQFFMRCDSASVRRLLHISVSPTYEGLVRTTSLLFREDRRPEPVEIVHCGKKDDQEDCIPLCSWCNKIEVGEGWYEPEEAIERFEAEGGLIPLKVAHATCSTCRERMENLLGGNGSLGNSGT